LEADQVPGAVTLDFHNTLIHCDPWFDLEVRTLPSAVYDRIHPTADLAPDTIELTYRDLRREVMAHGNEMDAVAGTIETLNRLGMELDSTQISPIVEELFREMVELSTLVAGADELVAALSETGAPLGIVSSAVHHDFLEWCLIRHGLATSFDVITTSASAGYYKSNPEIYRIALDALECDAAVSVHIGDSFRFDHLSCQQIGMASVWLNSDRAEPNETDPAPDLAITSLTDLGPILDLVSRRRSNGLAD